MSGLIYFTDSNDRGGKAGRGKNKTATIQVCERIRVGHHFLLKQFRYTTGLIDSKEMAISKARKFIADKLASQKQD